MYESYFELTGRPFPAFPDTATYFPSPTHEAALALLQCCVCENEAIAVVIGRPGTGKTLLFHLLLEHLPAGRRAVLLTNPHTSTIEGLFQALLFDLELPSDNAGEQVLRSRFTAHVLESATAAGPLLVAVDEAHLLRVDQLEELRLLTNLETRSGRAVQVVLLGLPHLQETLNVPELEGFRQRIGAVATLIHWDSNQVSEYVRQRIKSRGGDAASIFTAAALVELAALSQGNPRRVNQLCHRSLTMAYAQQTGIVDAEHVTAAARLFLPEETVHSQQERLIQPKQTEDVGRQTAATANSSVVEVGADCPAPAWTAGKPEVQSVRRSNGAKPASEPGFASRLFRFYRGD